MDIMMGDGPSLGPRASSLTLYQSAALNRTPLPLGQESTPASAALTFFRAVDSKLGAPRQSSGGSESSLFLQESCKGMQHICMRAVLRGICEHGVSSSWWQT